MEKRSSVNKEQRRNDRQAKSVAIHSIVNAITPEREKSLESQQQQRKEMKERRHQRQGRKRGAVAEDHTDRLQQLTAWQKMGK